MSWTGNAIIAKAKSIYGKRLKEDDYRILAKKTTISEVVTYLKNKDSYSPTMEGVQEKSVHRGQLEELIKKNNFRKTLKLVKFVTMKDASFYELNIVLRENEYILSTIRSMISAYYDEAVGEIPIYLKQHASFDIFKLIQSRNFTELLEVLKHTDYYDLLKRFEVETKDEIRYVAIEHVLENYYYDCAFARINENYHGKLKKELEFIFKTKIELSNIIKIYRLKKFYHAEPETIRRIMVNKYSRISEKKFDYIISLEDPDAVLQYLQESDLSKYVDEDEYVYVEYYAERIKYNLAKRHMYYSNELPKVYLAFLILNEIETENLINIIEGIRYDLDEEEINKMLIY